MCRYSKLTSTCLIKSRCMLYLNTLWKGNSYRWICNKVSHKYNCPDMISTVSVVNPGKRGCLVHAVSKSGSDSNKGNAKDLTLCIRIIQNVKSLNKILSSFLPQSFYDEVNHMKPDKARTWLNVAWRKWSLFLGLFALLIVGLLHASVQLFLYRLVPSNTRTVFQWECVEYHIYYQII